MKLAARYLSLLRLIFCFLVVIAALGRVYAQRQSSTPMPEFYGTYAVANGQLVGIKPAQPRAGSIVTVQLG